jgi:O86/O127-antigen biosynthesis beta-1,3-galactosyltransferase
MPQPLVSVVMPIFITRQDFVRTAIKSLVEQDFCDWELVIVEDPSDCESRDTVKLFDDERILYFHNQHRTSLIEQRNLGLSKCRASMIAMLDADDVANPSRLSEQVTFLNQHDEIGVLGCQLSIIDATGNLIGTRDYPTNHEAILKGMMFRNMIPQPGVMFRKDAILQSGAYLYDRHSGLEDYDLWCRLLKAGVRFANHPERLQSYRIHSTQIKQSRMREQLLGTIEVKRQHFQGELGLLGWSRILAEYVLTYLPSAWVMRLFSATYLKSEKRSGHPRV